MVIPTVRKSSCINIVKKKSIYKNISSLAALTIVYNTT